MMQNDKHLTSLPAVQVHSKSGCSCDGVNT